MQEASNNVEFQGGELNKLGQRWDKDFLLTIHLSVSCISCIKTH